MCARTSTSGFVARERQSRCQTRQNALSSLVCSVTRLGRVETDAGRVRSASNGSTCAWLAFARVGSRPWVEASEGGMYLGWRVSVWRCVSRVNALVRKDHSNTDAAATCSHDARPGACPVSLTHFQLRARRGVWSGVPSLQCGLLCATPTHVCSLGSGVAVRLGVWLSLSLLADQLRCFSMIQGSLYENNDDSLRVVCF